MQFFNMMIFIIIISQHCFLNMKTIIQSINKEYDVNILMWNVQVIINSYCTCSKG